MFRRMLLLTVCAAACAAVLSTNVSAGGGVKINTVFPPFPPLTTVPLPAVCRLKVDGLLELSCHATVPNPNPPKDQKTIDIACGPGQLNGRLTAYPDGEVTFFCRIA
jgi:hypothetical protein